MHVLLPIYCLLHGETLSLLNLLQPLNTDDLLVEFAGSIMGTTNRSYVSFIHVQYVLVVALAVLPQASGFL